VSGTTTSSTDSNNPSGSATTLGDDEAGDSDGDSTVPVEGSVVTAPVVIDDEAQRNNNNRGSDLQSSDSSATPGNNSPATTVGGTSTVHGGAGINSLGATDLTVSGTDTDVATITDTNTVTLITDLPLDSQNAAPSGDPVPSLTAIDLESGQLVDVDLSTNGPIAPPLPGVMLGGLDQVRRDLEKGFNSGSVTQASTVQADPPNPSWSVPDKLTLDPTSAERLAAFQKQQAERLGAFNQAQTARVAAFNQQLAETSAANPIGALLNSAAFVVSELVNTAAVVVTEFVNFISFGITQFIQGISDWFNTPAVFTGMYGDPATNGRYWQSQRAENCVLQSMAMIINQLKGTAVPVPDEEAIARLAAETQSVANPDEKMYEGLYKADGVTTTTDRVDIKDGLKLLDMYGITATLTKYEKTEGNLALRALAFALADRTKAVSVGLQGGTIWNEVEGNPLPNISSADHQVVVIGIDFDAKIVHLNDSGFHENGNDAGRNLKVSLDTFMRAWQTDSYETIVASLKVPNTLARVASPDVSGSTELVSVR
jgi:hypothetical protein